MSTRISKKAKKTAGMSIGIVILFIMVMSVTAAAMLAVSTSALRSAQLLPQQDATFFSAEAAMNKAVTGVTVTLASDVIESADLAPLLPVIQAIDSVTSLTSISPNDLRNELFNGTGDAPIQEIHDIIDNFINDAVNPLTGLPDNIRNDVVRNAILAGTHPDLGNTDLWLADVSANPLQGLGASAFADLRRDGTAHDAPVWFDWLTDGDFVNGIRIGPLVGPDPVTGEWHFDVFLAPVIEFISLSGSTELNQQIEIPFNAFRITFVQLFWVKTLDTYPDTPPGSSGLQVQTGTTPTIGLGGFFVTAAQARANNFIEIRTDPDRGGLPFLTWRIERGPPGLPFAIGSLTDPHAVFVMPNEEVVIRAVYDTPSGLNLVLNNPHGANNCGAVINQGAGSGLEASIFSSATVLTMPIQSHFINPFPDLVPVRLYAGNRVGMVFDGWTASDGINTADIQNRDHPTAAFFLIPDTLASDIVVTANWDTPTIPPPPTGNPSSNFYHTCTNASPDIDGNVTCGNPCILLPDASWSESQTGYNNGNPPNITVNGGQPGNSHCLPRMTDTVGGVEGYNDFRDRHISDATNGFDVTTGGTATTPAGGNVREVAVYPNGWMHIHVGSPNADSPTIHRTGGTNPTISVNGGSAFSAPQTSVRILESYGNITFTGDWTGVDLLADFLTSTLGNATVPFVMENSAGNISAVIAGDITVNFIDGTRFAHAYVISRGNMMFDSPGGANNIRNIRLCATFIANRMNNVNNRIRATAWGTTGTQCNCNGNTFSIPQFLSYQVIDMDMESRPPFPGGSRYFPMGALFMSASGDAIRTTVNNDNAPFHGLFLGQANAAINSLSGNTDLVMPPRLPCMPLIPRLAAWFGGTPPPPTLADMNIYDMQIDPDWSDILSDTTHGLMRGTGTTTGATRSDGPPRSLNIPNRSDATHGLRISINRLLDNFMHSTANGVEIWYEGTLTDLGEGQLRIGSEVVNSATFGSNNFFSVYAVIPREASGVVTGTTTNSNLTSNRGSNISLGGIPDNADLIINNVIINQYTGVPPSPIMPPPPILTLITTSGFTPASVPPAELPTMDFSFNNATNPETGLNITGLRRRG